MMLPIELDQQPAHIKEYYATMGDEAIEAVFECWGELDFTFIFSKLSNDHKLWRIAKALESEGKLDELCFTLEDYYFGETNDEAMSPSDLIKLAVECDDDFYCLVHDDMINCYEEWCENEY